MDSKRLAQVGVCGEVAAELQGADGEDTRRHRQGGDKGAEDVMLKRRGKGEEGAFQGFQVFGRAFLPFVYQQLVIGELLQVDQSRERCRSIPQRFSFLPVCCRQFSFALPQLVHYLLMLADHRQLFTNLEVNFFHLHLPGFQSLGVFFLCFIVVWLLKCWT